MVTKRTNIIGAHQQGVFVKAGSKLKGDKRSVLEYKRLYFFMAVALPLLATDWIPAKSTLGVMKSKIVASYSALAYLPTGFQLVLLWAIGILGYFLSTTGKPYLTFAYNCFIKPFSVKKPSGVDSEEHQKRLEQFYSGQAEVYDLTRRRLLRGRSTMLKLCAAQMRQVYPCHFSKDFKVGVSGESVTDPATLPSPPLSPSFLTAPDTRYAWIDIGGGTGENIERMNSFFPIRNFDVVYLVDITPSLCEIARKRFERLGWTNVKVLCMDASQFKIPPEDGPEDLDIALITLSYSLSMMESYYSLVDHLTTVLSPNGILGVADFYVSPKRSSDPTRQLSWFSRWFWAMWFDQDNVYLSPGRREYLEYKFNTVKSLNCSNQFLPLVNIPYYVWLGTNHHRVSSVPDFNLDEELDEPVQIEEPPHPFASRWRQPFDIKLIERFSTYIYAFAWEDPRVDLQYLDLKPSDRMFIISSGGCNALEYAAKVGPERIHCVDLNPCQNHMLELKLAGITALSYSEFWQLFGEGHIDNFSGLLDTQLSPHLSTYAYHFWKRNSGFKNLFKTGCSGLAIRVFQFVIRVRGLKGVVERFCNAESIEEQKKIWEEELRQHFLSKWLVRILNNDRFLWGALGVPPAQMQMLLEEGSAHDYCINTLDPVIANSHLRDDNYFYYMPLMLKYNRNATGNPAYLTPEGFETLQKEPARLDAIRIHTDMIINVLSKLNDGELTKVILMDHLDWFSEEDAFAEISAVHQKTAVGGKVFWRSAGKTPWYNEIFESVGFKVSPCQIRQGSCYIDRVNMYASFWQGVKQ